MSFRDAQPPVTDLVGMSIWKQRRIGEILTPLFGRPRFHTRAAAAVAAARARGGAVGVWATRAPAELAGLAAEAGVPVVRIEDGFIRSVGLGADFMPGLSIICDRRGVYYDPATQSDLEAILAGQAFDPGLVARAAKLREALVARGITKYNTGGGAFEFAARDGVRRLFVPGQVEDDQSVALGGAGISTNLDLLRAVRAQNPDAFILYKPHPDVDAGHRIGAIPDSEAETLADQVVRGVSTAAILPKVDEVHTLTSLAGFEALLRKIPVTVYGRPFYAGWGLTTDRAPISRRGRSLGLDELVAGALILYPYYFDPVTKRICEVELVIERLADPRLWRPSVLTRLRRLCGRAFSRPRSGGAA